MKKKVVFNIDDKNLITNFSNYLSCELATSLRANKDIIFLCIGTDRSTGDSLGPLVGHKLWTLLKDKFLVLGNLQNPVHAKNLRETMDFIKSNYKNPFIIAIDACLGNVKNIGNIVIENGPLLPGSAMNKNLPGVGDLSISAIVNVCGPFDFIVLQSTRLYTVMHLADVISKCIYFSTLKLSKEDDSTYNDSSYYTNLENS